LDSLSSTVLLTKEDGLWTQDFFLCCGIGAGILHIPPLSQTSRSIGIASCKFVIIRVIRVAQIPAPTPTLPFKISPPLGGTNCPQLLPLTAPPSPCDSSREEKHRKRTLYMNTKQTIQTVIPNCTRRHLPAAFRARTELFPTRRSPGADGSVRRSSIQYPEPSILESISRSLTVAHGSLR
jgi:hypothetical protein